MILKQRLIKAESEFLASAQPKISVALWAVVADAGWYRRLWKKRGDNYSEEALLHLIRCARAYVKSMPANPEMIVNTRGNKTTRYYAIAYSSGLVSSRTLVPIEGRVIWPFGIHKGEDGSYFVTHLPSGLDMKTYPRLKDAKRLVELCQDVRRISFPFLYRPMGATSSDFRKALTRFYQEE